MIRSRQEDREAKLYDFGLSSAAAGFGLRTSSQALISSLDAAQGLCWSELLALNGAEIVRESPTRVAQNTIGRIEIYIRIPPSVGVSPAGPHTHLFPEQLAKGGDVCRHSNPRPMCRARSTILLLKAVPDRGLYHPVLRSASAVSNSVMLAVSVYF